ncbi:MAG: hypothetical protein GY804_02570 [Alphaproteobacteria bacterium]|nr:hypothetical protein [Alphaproteobacteria bacterium]
MYTRIGKLVFSLKGIMAIKCSETLTETTTDASSHQDFIEDEYLIMIEYESGEQYIVVWGDYNGYVTIDEKIFPIMEGGKEARNKAFDELEQMLYNISQANE